MIMKKISCRQSGPPAIRQKAEESHVHFTFIDAEIAGCTLVLKSEI
jgi:hypothetical protein